MDLNEKIAKQISAGFSVEEIRTNLTADGHSPVDIEAALGSIPAEDMAQPAGSVSPWSKVWTVVLAIVALVKVARLFERSVTAGLVSLVIVVAVLVGVYAYSTRRS